jgi:EAL domain-containing protein (putative c-di-GMP-specific phosphodiesterase class I)
MSIEQEVQQVIESGITPIEMVYQPVHMFDSPSIVQRTVLAINSLDVGRLEFDQYRFVAARCKHGERMLRCQVTKLLREISKAVDEDTLDNKIVCFTIPVYARNLRDGVLPEILYEGFTNFPKAQPSKICVEISADILYEDIDWLAEAVGTLREIGVKVAISEVGDAYCPVFRLAGVKFEYAFLDTHAIKLASTEQADETVKWLVEYLHARGTRVFAPNLEGDRERATMLAMGCDGYTEPAVVQEVV